MIQRNQNRKTKKKHQEIRDNKWGTGKTSDELLQDG